MLYKVCQCCRRKVKQGDMCECKSASTAERNKYYDRTQRNRESAGIYHSKEWRRVSEQCKVRCNGLDLYELYKNNRIVCGQLVHHIEEVATHPELAYDPDNLIYVSHRSHGRIHEEYKKNKNKMKKFLKECLERHRGT